MVQVGDRLAVESDKCTVRFIGEIPQWPGTITFGVEWDDAKRGKNSGVLDGVHYFDVSHPQSGSFIKSTNRKINFGTSLETTLNQVYRDNDAMKSIKWSQHKATENLGWDAHNELMRDYTQLESISVDNRNVNQVEITAKFPNLKMLDLSSNLLTDFSQILKGLKQMPNLKRLNVNGNRFNWQLLENFEEKEQFPQVEQLLLAATFIPPQMVSKLIQWLPNLTEVVLSFNQYSDFPVSLPFIGKIDLSYNRLSAIPTLKCTQLKVDHNQIVTIDPINATAIDLRHNLIASWLQVDKLVGVTSVRINDNPVFHGISVDDQIAQLVGRLGATKVNGVVINDLEQSELWFIGQVQKGNIDYPNNSRWQALLKKHQIKEVDTKPKYTNYPQVKLRFSGEYMGEKLYFHKASVLSIYGDIANRLDLTVREIELWGVWGTVRAPLDDYIQEIGDLQVDSIEVKLRNYKAKLIKTASSHVNDVALIK
ncbi:hypothetical protein DIURU_003728 [Diutina rugosa]|uniref:CAP-Gly domain-containing protein n=1 Tax=Diutina rugosa TaxID=5481 RepID=A0A642UKB4_DIURU|nr:uncharacterized protein DIURU_003728 [Diutina rugosa]KAA8900616.1 hypothetical protein DIURU_003728 [Diutina rugosa]